MTDALSEKVAELIGLGASAAGKCMPCLSYHFRRAKEVGASGEEIQQALAIGRGIRETPGRLVDRLADRLAGTNFVAADAPAGCCESEPVAGEAAPAGAAACCGPAAGGAGRASACSAPNPAGQGTTSGGCC